MLAAFISAFIAKFQEELPKHLYHEAADKLIEHFHEVKARTAEHNAINGAVSETPPTPPSIPVAESTAPPVKKTAAVKRLKKAAKKTPKKATKEAPSQVPRKAAKKSTSARSVKTTSKNARTKVNKGSTRAR
jgi:outer membrane biosynthesis protein TonB